MSSKGLKDLGRKHMARRLRVRDLGPAERERMLLAASHITSLKDGSILAVHLRQLDLKIFGGARGSWIAVHGWAALTPRLKIDGSAYDGRVLALSLFPSPKKKSTRPLRTSALRSTPKTTSILKTPSSTRSK